MSWQQTPEEMARDKAEELTSVKNLIKNFDQKFDKAVNAVNQTDLELNIGLLERLNHEVKAAREIMDDPKWTKDKNREVYINNFNNMFEKISKTQEDLRRRLANTTIIPPKGNSQVAKNQHTDFSVLNNPGPKSTNPSTNPFATLSELPEVKPETLINVADTTSQEKVATNARPASRPRSQKLVVPKEEKTYREYGDRGDALPDPNVTIGEFGVEGDALPNPDDTFGEYGIEGDPLPDPDGTFGEYGIAGDALPEDSPTNIPFATSNKLPITKPEDALNITDKLSNVKESLQESKEVYMPVPPSTPPDPVKFFAQQKAVEDARKADGIAKQQAEEATKLLAQSRDPNANSTKGIALGRPLNIPKP